MKTFKKYLYYFTTPCTFILFLIFTIIEDIGHGVTELLHMFEAWCFNYKDTGLKYRGEGIWSSKREGEE